MKVGTFDIDLIPTSQWGKSLANRLPRTHWQRIRKRELARANNKCELCGSTGFICHELWSFDVETKIQKLVGYKIICDKCDLVMHLGRANATGKQDDAIRQLAKLSGIRSAPELERLWHSIFDEWEERSKIKWKIDTSFEPETSKYF